MDLIKHLQSICDSILSRWPSAMGGTYLRLACWRKRFAYCGARVRFGDSLVVAGFSTIRIGEGTSFMSRSYLYANDSGLLTIGANCSFNHNVFFGANGGEIVIGDDVLIGPNVVLRAADHEFRDVELPIRMQGRRSGKIIIGSNVWLAANVVVTRNVTIGDGCIVGAGSVVTCDLPAMTVCVGNPARPIRSRLAQAVTQ